MTEFDPNDPKSCQIIGDSDIYGIGIRISFYLQWASLMLAIWLAPETTKNIRVSTNIVSVALFINVFRSVNSDSLVLLEFYLVSWMTIILLLVNIPWNRALIRESLVDTSIMLGMWMIFMWAQVYIYSKGLHIGQRAGCAIWTWGDSTSYSSAYQNIYKNVTLKLSGTISIAFASTFYMAVAVIGMCVLGAKPATHSARYHSKWSTIFRSILTIANAILGSISIVTVEKTIRRNHIDLSSAPLFKSSGQLIALVMGILSMITVIWAHINPPEEPEETSSKPSPSDQSSSTPQSNDNATLPTHKQIALNDLESAKPSRTPTRLNLIHPKTA